MQKQVTGNQKQENEQPYGFRKLIAWQRADDFASEAFRLSRLVSRSDRWLASQLFRAAVSVPLNISEGAGPATAAEFVRFLEIAGRSLSEADYCLHFIERNGILPPSELTRAKDLRAETARLVFRLTESIRAKVGRNGGWQRGMLREELAEYLADA